MPSLTCGIFRSHAFGCEKLRHTCPSKWGLGTLSQKGSDSLAHGRGIDAGEEVVMQAAGCFTPTATLGHRETSTGQHYEQEIAARGNANTQRRVQRLTKVTTSGVATSFRLQSCSRYPPR